MLGGTTNQRDADGDIQNLCDKMRPKVEAHTGDTYDVFTALKYKTQLVAGTNYFIKVQIDDQGNCIHIRVFQPLPHTNEDPSVHSVQKGKTLEEEVEYFECNNF
jgi:cystatin-A/B